VQPEEVQALRNEVVHLQTERSLLWRERDDVRAEAERLREGTPPSTSGTAPEELLVLRNEVSRLEAEQAVLRRERDDARAEAEQGREETPPPAPAAAAPEELTAIKGEVAELESERDQLEQMNRNLRAEVEKLHAEVDEVRDAQSRALDEAGTLRTAKLGLEDEIGRVAQENVKFQEESARHVEEQAELGRRLAYEQAKTEQLAAEGRGLVARLAETGRKLEEARFELENPRQSVGFDQLEKFFEKAKLLPLLEKSVRGPKRKDQYSAAEMLYEFVGAVIGAQDQPLEAARNLTPRIHRPMRGPSLGELRQFIEGLHSSELAGARRRTTRSGPRSSRPRSGAIR
jgi:chromosome segregation ATPase